ncbi:MAG: calcium-binding protein [Comamonadaceae bacterium CG_4_9_14_3_um_filter_60_33]|nr:MAG: calcium-binding protein [Comamonadaceae bacterium CG_4_10_14_3_um_filter_60_42]PJB46352.1 MAG: calcium-binding protein [Comamonadaceae bacterium CG_4_9_14_3_um_filter_60_33]
MATALQHRLAVWLALAACVAYAQAASPVHRCVVDGKVTFQNTPCATEKPTRQPTAEELNAARKKRLAEAASQASSAAKPALSSAPGGSRPVDLPQSPTPSRDPVFRCDGRTHCSQMRSCGEAKYFLANCPGVKMDGNRDGTPCEQQWCTHPLAK